MSDIVTDLRELGANGKTVLIRSIAIDAANEIERLTAALDLIRRTAIPDPYDERSGSAIQLGAIARAALEVGK